MKVRFFPSLYYWLYDIPNFEELKDYVKSKENIYTNEHPWQKNCLIDTTTIDDTDFIDVLKPSLELFTREALKDVDNIKFEQPWINHYKRGYYQELHDHRNADISSVFFINEGKKFGKFFFSNRYSITASSRLLKALKQDDLTCDICYPVDSESQAGQVLFFPSTMLHGVTPHKSDVIRETLSCNFNIV